MLNGTGSNGQIKGILQTTGIPDTEYTDASPTVPEMLPSIFLGRVATRWIAFRCVAGVS